MWVYSASFFCRMGSSGARKRRVIPSTTRSGERLARYSAGVRCSVARNRALKVLRSAKAVPQGNIGQVVVGDGKIIQGVLEPYPGQVFVKVDADDLLEQGGNVGAVVLGIVSQIFQRQLGGIVFLHILQQPPGDGAPLKILRQGVEVFWLELGAEMDGEQLEGGFGRKLGVWPPCCKMRNSWLA